QLWDLCCQEQPFPHLSSLLRFIGDLRSDDLTRLSGQALSTSTAVVSTVHKVKGLEFDHVIILPSIASFPFNTQPRAAPNLAADAVEEARLLYVGMTRAKARLTYFAGDREFRWASRAPTAFIGMNANGLVLMGSMEDVFLGWSMLQTPFNPDPNQCQHYIETQVAVGDPITLGGRGGGAGRCLMHRRRNGHPATQVGYLANGHGAGGPHAALQVSAVVRFRPDAENNGALAGIVAKRGWGYVVLVSGQLR
ncbi:MAG: ATP-binding domain-containing protein, partial [Xanthomonadales bacterium]|nr:ATP-binding domain-containing protein [Xanthomonadales bacterium]